MLTHFACSDKRMWLLKETVAGKETESKSRKPYCIAHLVDVTEFLWNDTPANIPPICHSCPKYVNGCIPCIGILVLLSNLKPLVNEVSTTSWQQGKGLMRPEIFINRWRVDRDPTAFLENYSPPAPPKHRESTKSQPVEAVDFSTWADRLDQNLRVALELDALPRQSALLTLNGLMNQMDRVVAKFKFDAQLARTSQVHPQAFISYLMSNLHTLSG
jgi:hypothetical protein